MPSPLLLVAAVALVNEKGEILIAQRRPGKHLEGHWEFPGGKFENGETPEATLVREIREELGIDIAPADLFPLAFASHDYGHMHVLMPLFSCRKWTGEPRSCEGQNFAWVAPGDLLSYPLVPADVPLAKQIMSGHAL